MLAAMLDLPRWGAVGLLEMLWHFTARYSPRGDVGKHSDRQIAAAMDWRAEPERLVQALVDARWLDRVEGGRLWVHDWHEHCDGAADKYLADRGERYANGAEPRRLVTTSRDKSRLAGEENGGSRDKSREVATSRDARAAAHAGARVFSSPSPSPDSSGVGADPEVGCHVEAVERLRRTVAEVYRRLPGARLSAEEERLALNVARLGLAGEAECELFATWVGSAEGEERRDVPRKARTALEGWASHLDAARAWRKKETGGDAEEGEAWRPHEKRGGGEG
jgi:hypothetical protein